MTGWKVKCLVSGMETNDPKNQLHEVERLQGETLREQHQLPAWAFPALAVGATASLAIAVAGRSVLFIAVAIVAWDVFMFVWWRTTSKRNRAKASRARMTRTDLAATAAANVLVWGLIATVGLRAIAVIVVCYIAYLVYFSVDEIRGRAKYGH